MGRTVVTSGAKEAEVSVYQGTLLAGCRLLPGTLASRCLHPALCGVSTDRGPSEEMRWEARAAWRRSVDTTGGPRASVVAAAGALHQVFILQLSFQKDVTFVIICKPVYTTYSLGLTILYH